MSGFTDTQGTGRHYKIEESAVDMLHTAVESGNKDRVEQILEKQTLKFLNITKNTNDYTCKKNESDCQEPFETFEELKDHLETTDCGGDTLASDTHNDKTALDIARKIRIDKYGKKWDTIIQMLIDSLPKPEKEHEEDYEWKAKKGNLNYWSQKNLQYENKEIKKCMDFTPPWELYSYAQLDMGDWCKGCGKTEYQLNISSMEGKMGTSRKCKKCKTFFCGECKKKFMKKNFSIQYNVCKECKDVKPFEQNPKKKELSKHCRNKIDSIMEQKDENKENAKKNKRRKPILNMDDDCKTELATVIEQKNYNSRRFNQMNNKNFCDKKIINAKDTGETQCKFYLLGDVDRKGLSGKQNYKFRCLPKGITDNEMKQKERINSNYIHDEENKYREENEKYKELKRNIKIMRKLKELNVEIETEDTSQEILDKYYHIPQTAKETYKSIPIPHEHMTAENLNNHNPIIYKAYLGEQKRKQLVHLLDVINNDIEYDYKYNLDKIEKDMIDTVYPLVKKYKEARIFTDTQMRRLISYYIHTQQEAEHIATLSKDQYEEEKLEQIRKNIDVTRANELEQIRKNIEGKNIEATSANNVIKKKKLLEKATYEDAKKVREKLLEKATYEDAKKVREKILNVKEKTEEVEKAKKMEEEKQKERKKERIKQSNLRERIIKRRENNDVKEETTDDYINIFGEAAQKARKAATLIQRRQRGIRGRKVAQRKREDYSNQGGAWPTDFLKGKKKYKKSKKTRKKKSKKTRNKKSKKTRNKKSKKTRKKKYIN